LKNIHQIPVDAAWGMGLDTFTLYIEIIQRLRAVDLATAVLMEVSSCSVRISMVGISQWLGSLCHKDLY
jgi:hypothetical protein